MTSPNYSNGLYFQTYLTESEHIFVEEEIRSIYKHSVCFYRKLTPHKNCFRECFIEGDVASIQLTLESIVKIILD